nr:hypothetical protein [Tanacetum cinerariifolium]
MLFIMPTEAGGKDRPPMLVPGTLETTTEGYMENYKNFLEDIRKQLDAEAEVVQIILTGIDNDIYSTVDAFPNACEIWKAIERLKQGKVIVNSLPPTYDQILDMVTKNDTLSKEKEIDKLMDLISLSFKKIYKPTNNNLKTSSNTSRVNQDNTPRTNIRTGECQKPKRAKDVAYHKEKILLCKQEEARIQLSTEQVDWRDDTDDEPEDRELEAHYLYKAKIQEVSLDAADNSGPVFDVVPLQKVQNDNDNYNVFSNDREHPEQLGSINDTYPDEQGDTNITTDSLDMSTNREEAD